jgi:5-formyltetrahydrofolate cyclo-ligase
MTTTNPIDARKALRARLLTERRTWATTPPAEQAQTALHQRLMDVLAQLEPDCLGLYWPVKGEFNPMAAALAAKTQWDCRLALPFAQRQPVAMHYRAWDGQTPGTQDECGIPSPEGKPVEPDVVLVPCLGFTPEGYRLGYGGGYFDRYLANHPDVTAIGVAWEGGALTLGDLSPQAHDISLMAILTEQRTLG